MKPIGSLQCTLSPYYSAIAASVALSACSSDSAASRTSDGGSAFGADSAAGREVDAGLDSGSRDATRRTLASCSTGEGVSDFYRTYFRCVSRRPLEVLVANGLTTSSVPGGTLVELYGMMCDRTVVLGCTELDGTAAPENSALDAQGGHLSDVKDARGIVQFANRYHTHVCPSRQGGQRYTPEIQYYKTCER